MAYNLEYESYLEKKHNLRFDTVNAISRSERIKAILSEGEFSVNEVDESFNPFTEPEIIEKEISVITRRKKYNLGSMLS